PAPEPPADGERGDGSTRAPWRWERLLVEASVIGGKERWAKRLGGLEEELRRRRTALVDAGEEARGQAIERQLADLAYLRAFAPAGAARGLAFAVVFVPGLAEKLLPRRIVEDPILLDTHRLALDAPGLATQPVRVAAERLALRLAVGAARERVVLSWPRIDVE